MNSRLVTRVSQLYRRLPVGDTPPTPSPLFFSLSPSLFSHSHAHRFANGGSCWLRRCTSRGYKGCLLPPPPPPPQMCHRVEPYDGNSPTFSPPVFIVFPAAAPPHHPPPLHLLASSPHLPPFYFHVEPLPAVRSLRRIPG